MEGGPDYTCLMVDGRQVAGAMPPMMEGVPPHWNVYFNVEDRRRHGRAGRPSSAARVVAPAFDVPDGRPDGGPRRPAGRDVQPDADPG